MKLRRRFSAVVECARGAFLSCLGFCIVIAIAVPGLASSRLRPARAPGSPASATAGQSAAGWPASQPQLSARAAIVEEESTGRVLYASNANVELAIASTTKLMTALLTLEHVSRLSTIFTASDYHLAPSDSQIGLARGERMSVHDLLLALLIPSADDAAEDLAYNVGGHSVARFIGMMNARARELGLSHTHYSTPSGLDTPGNYSSASDLVKLSVYLLEHYPWFKHAVGLSHAVLRTGDHRRYVVSTDTLLSEVPWINGVKTGHTAAAGYVLVGSGTRDGMSLVSAVLGTTSEAARDSNTLGLLGYAFSDFRLEHPVVSGTVVARPTVSDSPGVRVGVVARGGISEVVARTAGLTTHVDVPRQLAGPLQDHAVVGSVAVSDGRRVLARVPVELTRALPAISEWTLVGRFLARPTTLILLVLLIGGASVLARRRRGGMRAEINAPESGTGARPAVAEPGGGERAGAAARAGGGERAGAAARARGAERAAKAAADEGAVALERAVAQGRSAAKERTAELERVATAERSVAAERERRRAEREARRAAGNRDPTPSSARDRG